MPPTPSPTTTRAALAVDAVLLPVNPLTVTIAAGRTEVDKTVLLTVRNADAVARTLGVAIDASATDCPVNVAAAPDFGGGQGSILVPAGGFRRAKVRLAVRSGDFASFNAKAPTRCALVFRVSAQVAEASIDPSAENSVGRLELNVVNRNNPEQTTRHETWVKSRRPAALRIAAGAATATKRLTVVVGNADYRPPLEKPGDPLSLSAGTSCPGLSLGTPVCNPFTRSATVVVRGGATKRCTFTASATAAQFQTPNRLSPQRCTVTLHATGPTDPPLDASNDTTQLVVDVVDRNDERGAPPTN
jgi:hypothetical protein